MKIQCKMDMLLQSSEASISCGLSHCAAHKSRVEMVGVNDLAQVKLSTSDGIYIIMKSWFVSYDMRQKRALCWYARS